MGNSSFFNQPVAYDVIDEGGEGSGFYEGPAYTEIDPVAIASAVAAAAAFAAKAESDAQVAQDAASALLNSAGTAAPLMDGVAAAGTATKWAREDHRHPTDTTKADAAAVNSAMALKADAAAVNSALALKADAAAVNSALALKAPLASPTFSGTPTAPTPPAADNSDKIATTAFVLANGTSLGSATPVMDGTGAPGAATVASRQDHVHPTDTSRAPVASPTFTGTATAPVVSASGTTASTSTTTGSGIFAGGVGIAGALNVGGAIRSNVSMGAGYNFEGGGAVVLANNALQAFASQSAAIFWVRDATLTGHAALFFLGGGAVTIIAQTSAGLFTNVSTSGRASVYYNASLSAYVLENRTGATVNYTHGSIKIL